MVDTKYLSQNLISAASPVIALFGTHERSGYAPNASVQGSGVFVAGLGSKTEMDAAQTPAAVRKDAARVPEPRGRKR